MSVEDIRDEVLVDFAVSDSENIAETTIDRYVAEAIGEHNAAYAIDASDLPAREVPLVKLLVGIKLTNLRASVWATKNNLTSSTGYGSDRDTPFNKLTKQALALRAEYDKKCAAMGIASGSGSDTSLIVQGQLSVVDSEYEFRTPYTNDKTPFVAPTLGIIGTAASTLLSLLWNKCQETTFQSYVLFYKQGANVTMYDETNWDSDAGVPRIVDDALNLWSTNDVTKNSLKVTGLSPLTDYTFILAVSNRQNKWVYSNTYSVKTSA